MSTISSSTNRTWQTLAEAAAEQEERLFVGRALETVTFRGWLDEPAAVPQILNVHGPGGVGKTTLLGHCGRLAVADGWRVATVEGAGLEPTPEAFWATLNVPGRQEALEGPLQGRVLLIVDAFDRVSVLSSFLQQQVLPYLATSARVAVATRAPLAVSWGPGWSRAVRPLAVSGLTPDDSRELLSRRGVHDAEAVEEILQAAGGLPLGLSLAADLVSQVGARHIRAAPEWRLAVQSLSEQLLDDIDDEGLRGLLEAAAVVRQFDEPLLAAVSGRAQVGAEFARLCRLSVVRPAEHGLTLHADVRPLLESNLRWRSAERHEHLRSRAADYYRERAARARPEDRERLVAERLFLTGNALLHKLFFGAGPSEPMWVDTGRNEDHDAIVAAWLAWHDVIDAPEPVDPELRAAEEAWVGRLLDHSGLRLRVVRDAAGDLAAFHTAMPVYADSVDLLLAHPYRGAALRALLDQRGRADVVAADVDTARVWYLLVMGFAPDAPASTYPAVLQDSIGLMGRGGVFLSSPIPDEHRGLSRMLGFRPVPASTATFRGLAFDGHVLDLDQLGVDRWIEHLVHNRPVPRPLGRDELERELQAVLLEWKDDARLAISPLAGLADGSAAGLRERIAAAVDTARAEATQSQLLALHAVELGYLTGGLTHERAARRLAVSRSTFYRLLKRGVTATAAVMEQV